MGGVSALASGISAINNYQKAKQADKSATQFANQLMNIKEQNALKALQVPDLASLNLDRTAQQSATATEALQGMGPEGAAQIANLNKGVLEQQAQTANDQAQLVYNRDAAQAEAQQGINTRDALRKESVLTSKLEGAQAEAANRRGQGASGVEGAIYGLGDLASGIIGVKGQGLGYPTNK